MKKKFLALCCSVFLCVALVACDGNGTADIPVDGQPSTDLAVVKPSEEPSAAQSSTPAPSEEPSVASEETKESESVDESSEPSETPSEEPTPEVSTETSEPSEVPEDPSKPSAEPAPSEEPSAPPATPEPPAPSEPPAPPASGVTTDASGLVACGYNNFVDAGTYTYKSRCRDDRSQITDESVTIGKYSSSPDGNGYDLIQGKVVFSVTSSGAVQNGYSCYAGVTDFYHYSEKSNFVDLTEIAYTEFTINYNGVSYDRCVVGYSLVDTGWLIDANDAYYTEVIFEYYVFVPSGYDGLTIWVGTRPEDFSSYLTLSDYSNLMLYRCN